MPQPAQARGHGHQAACPAPSPGVEAALPKESAGTDEEPGPRGPQRARSFPGWESGEGPQEAGVLPNRWDPLDPKACRAEAGGSPLGTSEEQLGGKTLRTGPEGPERSLRREAAGGCGRLCEAAGGCGRRRKRPGRAPDDSGPLPPQHGLGGRGGPRRSRDRTGPGHPGRRQTPRPARRQSPGAGRAGNAGAGPGSVHVEQDPRQGAKAAGRVC